MIGRIEAVHPDVARALRAKSGMERLRLAHETWELTRERLGAYLAARHPEWSQAEIDREVACRLLGDPAIVRVSRSELDEAYVAEWAGRLGVAGIWEQVRRQAE